MVGLTVLEMDRWPQTIDDFRRLVETTQDELVHYAFYRLGNHADAEDAVQDVYVAAFRDREKRRGITEVRPYLFRMVGNRCTDVLRSRMRRQSVPVADEVIGPVDAFSSLQARDEAREIARLLEQIPENEAEVIRLRAWSELSFLEIAAAVGAGLPTVKSRFRYGLEKLRRLLPVKGDASR
jgi:RNA polymerase sigma-70 factor (ECF subfamily)